MGSARWFVTEQEQQTYIEALTQELAPLRAKAGISQIELCRLVGISRQTYSAVEGRRRPMTWQIYLTLIWFFDSNLETRPMLRALPAYPADLLDRLNGGKDVGGNGLLEQGSEEFREIWDELDEQAMHSIRTLLLVEYARCKKIPGDVVVKAFDGLTLSRGGGSSATEQAIRNIRNKDHGSKSAQ